MKFVGKKKKKSIYINLTFIWVRKEKKSLLAKSYKYLPWLYIVAPRSICPRKPSENVGSITSLEFVTQFAEPGAWIEIRPYLVKNLQVKGQVHITSYVKIYSLCYLFYTCVDWKTFNSSVFKFFPNSKHVCISWLRKQEGCNVEFLLLKFWVT